MTDGFASEQRRDFMVQTKEHGEVALDPKAYALIIAFGIDGSLEVTTPVGMSQRIIAGLLTKMSDQLLTVADIENEPELTDQEKDALEDAVKLTAG